MTRLRTHSLFVQKTIEFMLLCGKISYRERAEEKFGVLFQQLTFGHVCEGGSRWRWGLGCTWFHHHTLRAAKQRMRDNVDSYLGVLEHFNFVNFKSTCWWNIQFQLFSHALKDKCIVWDSWEIWKCKTCGAGAAYQALWKSSPAKKVGWSWSIFHPGNMG